MKKFKNAFTLIEILMAFLLLTILMLAVSNYFFQGKLVYNKLSNIKFQKNDMNELMNDLKKIVIYNDINFTMNASKIYFMKDDNNRLYYTEYFIKDEGSNIELHKRELLYPYNPEKINSTESLKVADIKESIEWHVLNPMKHENTNEIEENNDKENFKSFTNWSYKELPQIFEMIIDGNYKYSTWFANNGYTFDNNQLYLAEEIEND